MSAWCSCFCVVPVLLLHPYHVEKYSVSNFLKQGATAAKQFIEMNTGKQIQTVNQAESQSISKQHTVSKIQNAKSKAEVTYTKKWYMTSIWKHTHTHTLIEKATFVFMNMCFYFLLLAVIYSIAAYIPHLYCFVNENKTPECKEPNSESRDLERDSYIMYI